MTATTTTTGEMITPPTEMNKHMDGSLTRTLEEIPEIVVGDDWFCGNEFPNQLIDDFAREFWFRNQRYRISVQRVDESVYEEDDEGVV